MSKKVKYIFDSNSFGSVPGSPIAYWLTDKEKEIFKKGVSLSVFANCCTGMQTGNNNKYIRLWYEVDFTNTQLFKGKGKWYRYNCGGESRKWYGNYLNLVNWNNNGSDIRNERSSVIRNEQFFFREGITWKRISSGSFSFRYLPKEFIFDQAGDSMFAKDASLLQYIMAFVNSNVAFRLSECISPTLNLTAGNMIKMPLILDEKRINIINGLASKCIEVSREEWNSFETSWNFEQHPLI